MHRRCCRPPAGNIVGVHYTTSWNTQSSVLEDGQNNCPKHVQLTGIINKPLLLHLVGCLYYLYQWCMVKQISDNKIYLLIKYVRSFRWRWVKRLSYIEDAQCLKVKHLTTTLNLNCTSELISYLIDKSLWLNCKKQYTKLLWFSGWKDLLVCLSTY
jgi:hypothetical protein